MGAFLGRLQISGFWSRSDSRAVPRAPSPQNKSTARAESPVAMFGLREREAYKTNPDRGGDDDQRERNDRRIHREPGWNALLLPVHVLRL